MKISYTYTFPRLRTIHFQWPYTPSKPSVLPPPARSTGPLGTLPPKLCMRSRATPQQRLICNRGLKQQRLGSEAHVRHLEARSQRLSKTKTDQARVAQAVQTTACLATTAVTSPRSPYCDARFAVVSCAHATSFLFHSALSLQSSTLQPHASMPVRSAPNTRPTTRP